MSLNKTIDQLHIDVIELVKRATGVALVIRSHENGQKPRGEYASILLLNALPIGLNATVLEDEDVTDELTERVQGNVAYTFSVQFYRGEPMSRASILSAFSQTSAGSEWLLLQNIAMNSVSTPLDSSYSHAEKWIKRCTLNLTLIAGTELTAPLSTIGEVTVVVNDEEQIVIEEP